MSYSTNISAFLFLIFQKMLFLSFFNSWICSDHVSGRFFVIVIFAALKDW